MIPSVGIPSVGIVGGGQLAMMMAEAAIDMGMTIRVLARDSDESVTGLGVTVDRADHLDTATLLSFAEQVDVVTFDHEPVDDATFAAVISVEAAGHVVFPGSSVLAFSDKAHQRQRLAELGIAVPPFALADSIDVIDEFAAEFGWPLVMKLPRGGYDGRGVFVVSGRSEAERLLHDIGALMVVEPHLELDAEIAVLIVRGRAGEIDTYPLVDTTQTEGICREVTMPTGLDEPLVVAAEQLAQRVAEVVGAVGVLAVEMFVVDGELLVNEVAPRPHNSGHLTIEACRTSQFENHLRAVAGMALGPCDLVVPAAAMVNLIASSDEPHLRVLDDPPSHAEFVHDYHKTSRAGRKIGHVTAVGETVEAAIARAHQRADTLMTSAVVGIVMGSDSDLEVMRPAAEALAELGVATEMRVVSAHRTPDDMIAYGRTAAARGVRVIIAGAGGAAHLPGMLAAVTTLPVIGVPVALRHLQGLDSLLSIVQMPRGVPVATVAIDNGRNAGLLAARILASAGDPEGQRLTVELERFADRQADAARGADRTVRSQ